MKKALAGLVGVALLVLWGGGAASPAAGTTTGTTTQITTTTEPFVPATIAYTPPTTAPWEPNDPPAVMEPLQGGKMLYTYYGKEPYGTEYSEYDGEDYPAYPIGIINQDGKVVTAPKYHWTKYFYDESKQRIMGLATVMDSEITIYQLNGESRVLPCKGYRVEVCPGGRYVIVETEKPREFGAYAVSDPYNDGLFDIESNRCAVEPKEGQMIQCENGGMVFGHQYDSRLEPRNQTAQWAFNCTDGSRMDVSMELGRLSNYYPKTGWFSTALHGTSTWNYKYYDANLEEIDSGYERLPSNNYEPSEPSENQRELPNLMQHFPKDAKPEDYGFPDYLLAEADDLITRDDFIVARVYFAKECQLEELERFIVDWDGNKITDHPLAAYLDQLSEYTSASPQGPNYFWVEKDGKRGYVNIQGKWVFTAND